MRLIDADALMEASKYEFWQDGSAITPIGEYILGKFRQLIRNMPTVEPERKKGKWLDAQYPFGKCDKCGAYMDIVNNEANYCCVCGAEMGVQDERAI